MEQRFSASGHICLALTFLITCHSKNHKKDGLQIVDGIMTSKTFKQNFCSYSLVKDLKVTSADSDTWIDVYGEFTFNKLHMNYDPEVYDYRLAKFSSQFTKVMGSKSFLKTILRCKVFILSGRLFQLLTLVLFKELDMVVDDHDFQSYLPPHLTKSAGSVKLLQ